jgi:cell cycle checkpoint protein
MDLPPTCTKITLTAMPADTTHPPELLEATGSSNQRRYHRADVGGFSITAKGDFGQTDVSFLVSYRQGEIADVQLDYPNDREVMDKFDCNTKISFR